MKHLNLFYAIALLAGGLIFVACQEGSLYDDSLEVRAIPTINDEDQVQAGPTLERGMREIPFKANFYTNRVPEKLGEVDCPNPELPGPNYQEGYGTATHLGKMHVVLTFCGGAGGVYGNIKGYLEAANGDRLYVKPVSGITGQVILFPPGSDPVYDAYFKDPVYFEGGTGRFENAYGEAMFDSKVYLWNDEYPFPGPIIPDHRTDHVVTGTLTLPNGK